MLCHSELAGLVKDQVRESVFEYLVATELGGLLLALLRVTCSLLVVKAGVLCLYRREAQLNRLIEEIPE